VKFLQSLNGARFVRPFLVGRGHDFLCTFAQTRKLTLKQASVVTVTGKAFWDVGHAPKDGSNRRSHLPGYACYEIHPVMRLTVQP
jgi:hypothetical protein